MPTDCLVVRKSPFVVTLNDYISNSQLINYIALDFSYYVLPERPEINTISILILYADLDMDVFRDIVPFQHLKVRKKIKQILIYCKKRLLFVKNILVDYKGDLNE